MVNSIRAQELYEEGARRLLEGDVHEAVRLFDASLDAEPTAEGYTFRGWAVSYLGRVDEAIDDCRRAIRIDPGFGNPYNDIGVYLMRQGKLEEAIPWFESAKKAPRYDSRHFPYLNLGRIYMLKGDEMRALDELAAALEIEPDDTVALEALKSMNYTVN